MILETPLEDAWAALSTLAPARGTLAGHTGTAVLEEADDDTHTARLRLQGTGPSGPVTATVTATLEPAAGGTRLHLATRAHPDPPDAASIELIADTIATWIARRVTPPAPEVAPAAAAPPSAPEAAPPSAPAPEVAPPAAAAAEPVGPSRRAKWVAAGVAAAGLAVAARRRRR